MGEDNKKYLITLQLLVNKQHVINQTVYIFIDKKHMFTNMFSTINTDKTIGTHKKTFPSSYSY